MELYPYFMDLGNLPTMMPMERTGQRRRKKLRRMRCRHQKIRKGTSGYALRAFPANLKSGQFICSQSGQFYLLTTQIQAEGLRLKKGNHHNFPLFFLQSSAVSLKPYFNLCL